MDNELLPILEQRLGRLHARQRLGIEADHEAQIFGQGLNFFHIENWYSVHSVIRTVLKLSGLYWRGRKNAEHIVLNENDIRCDRLPAAFDGFTILTLAVEIIMQRDLSLNVKEALFRVGFVFIMMLLAFVIYNDISKILPAG